MGTAKRERQKANRAKRKLEEAQTVQSANRRRTALRWGLGLVAAFLGVVLIAWLGGAIGGNDDTDDEVPATTLETLPATTLETLPATTAEAVAATTPATTEDSPATTDNSTENAAATDCPATDGSAEPRQSFDQRPPDCLEPGAAYSAEVLTSQGAVIIELDAANKPITVNNFVTLARHHYFDGTPCHRIIPGFMAQCGDPTGTGTGGPGYSIPGELTGDERYERGTVAMANSGGNADTAGSQFFIVTADTDLPPDYTVFGQVAEGFDTTLDALDAVGNPDPGSNGVPPLEPVTIESVTIVQS